jgi:putative flippase GtrA
MNAPEQWRWPESKPLRGREAELPLLVQMVAYGFVGLLNTLVDLATFLVFISIGVGGLIANPISFSLGAINSLLLNRVTTFRGRKTSAGLVLALKFGAVTLFTLVVSQVVLIAAIKSGSTEIRGKFYSTLVTFLVGFCLNRYFAFRREETRTGR